MKRKEITSPYWFIFLPAILVFSLDCNRIRNTNGHPQYLDKIFDSAKKLSDSGFPNKAFAYLDSSYEVFNYTDKYDLVRKYHVKSFYYIEISHEYLKALPLIDSILMILENNPGKNKDEYAYALVEKGHILLEQNEFNEAFNSYYTAKIFLQKYSDTCGQAQISNNLGLILYKQEKYEGAKDYFQKAFEESASCPVGGNTSTIADMQGFLDNIALCYDHLGMYDSAVLYYTKALNFIAINEKNFPPYSDTYIAMARAVIYGNLGGVYAKMKNSEKAEPLLKESIRINEQPGYYNYDAQYTSIKLANLYLESGKFDQAFAVMQHTRRSLDSVPSEDAELRWRKFAWAYYDSLRNNEQAYKYYKSYITFKDSFDLKRKDLPGADFNKTFANLSQLYQIDLLKKSNQVKNAYLILVLVLIVMALGIIFLVRRNYRQSKRNVVRLISLNKQIGDQNIHMQKTLNALEQSQEENTRMLKVITHDLRNPITSIVAIADMLLSNGGFGAEINQLLEIMRRSGLTATRMAEEILRAHSTEMQMDKVELHELLTFTVNMMQFKAKEKKQNIILKAEPVVLKANSDKLWRVMNNLIGNAIKFSPEGKPIEVSLTRKETVALVSIKDHGIGIAQDLREKVFDAFTPYKRPGTMGEESFGLGLSISKYIIDAHGGRIWFDSELGKGSTFYVELRLDPEKENLAEDK